MGRETESVFWLAQAGVLGLLQVVPGLLLGAEHTHHTITGPLVLPRSPVSSSVPEFPRKAANTPKQGLGDELMLRISGLLLMRADKAGEEGGQAVKGKSHS